MAINNFIPGVWAARLLENLRKAHVYAQEGVVNKDYEGEIKDKGDRVKINSIGPVTIGDYTKNVAIGDPETLTDAQKELLIDQAKYFNFQVDDIDRAQQVPKLLQAAMEEASYGLRDKQDQYVASLYTGVDAANTIGNDTTPIIPTTVTAYERLVDLSVLLDDANIPMENRWCVVPPWFHGLLLKDERFVKSVNMQTQTTLASGHVGDAAGFRIMRSTNVPNTTGTKYKIIAGHPCAISVAEQIVSIESYRPEKRFADAVKGLLVYGAKLVRPTGIAVLTANKS